MDEITDPSLKAISRIRHLFHAPLINDILFIRKYEEGTKEVRKTLKIRQGALNSYQNAMRYRKQV